MKFFAQLCEECQSEKNRNSLDSLLSQHQHQLKQVTFRNCSFAHKTFLTEVVFLFHKCYAAWCCQKGTGASRPLLGANWKQMLGQRGFLLARVYVLQHIPFHLLHVSALLRSPPSFMSIQLEPRAAMAGARWRQELESLWRVWLGLASCELLTAGSRSLVTLV